MGRKIYTSSEAEAHAYLAENGWNFKTADPADPAFRPCPRCGGSGRYAYNPMDGDMCYGCRGRGWFRTGGTNLDRAHTLVVKAKKKEAALARKAEKLAENRRAQRRSFRDLDPEVRAAFVAMRNENHGLMNDLRRKLIRWGSLSSAQQALAIKVAREHLNREPAKAERWVPAPEGRQTVRGTVAARKEVETSFGPTDKMMVIVGDPAEGAWKLWCTVPSGALGAQRGCEVELNVTVTRSKQDPCFAFGSRPAKARVTKTV